jgi:beta-lactamase regulating signal transducer with metallopeptidase domain
MKVLIDWIPDALLQALGWTLVHSLWQLILIASLLWLVLKIAHRSRPAVKYGLAVGALVLSLVVSVGTFSYEYSLGNRQTALLSANDLENILVSPSMLRAEAGIESGIDRASFWIEQNIPLLVNLWILGSLLFLFRLVNSLSEIRGLRKSSNAVTDFQLQKTLYRMAEKMGITSEVELRISSFGVSPLTFGSFKSVILFPGGLLFQLAPAQLEAIIAHELAHVKRNDYLANLLLSGLEVIFFFHPCYWWMNSTVKELRENAADDLVMRTGIEPKTLATSLAEVLNFAKQNPPELALAAGKQRNPTLQRIKRILGYPSQNYPQTPIISIPMVLTLFLSVGLMASAQQDAPKQTGPITSSAPTVEVEQTPAPVAVQDTVKKAKEPKVNATSFGYGEHVITNEEGETFRIKGDLLISDGDTVVMSAKTKAALDQLRTFDSENMPHFDVPMAPDFPMDFTVAPIPPFEFTMDMQVMASIPPMPPMDMADFSFAMPEMDMSFDVGFDQDFAPFHFSTDTTKMTKEEKEKWAKEMELKAKEWEEKFEKDFEPKIKEFENKMKEWEAANGPKMKEFEAKIEAWQAANGPKMEEFEAKMEEWQAANGPKMKEFEEKMKAWQEAQGPKMEEFELKMKEWEAAQKPKMEEFQRKMEVWQKEHQTKMEEFQKLLQEDLKKNDN